MIVYYYVIVGWLTLCFSDIIIDGVRASSLVGRMADLSDIEVGWIWCWLAMQVDFVVIELE